MSLQRRPAPIQIAIYFLLALGIVLLLISMFYASAFVAMFGLSLFFWSTILFYITPVKHVPYKLLEASGNAGSGNIERILTDLNFEEKGVYLPPKRLRSSNDSLIFIPKLPQTALPTSVDITEELYSKEKDGLLITPPGLDLSNLLEREFGSLFTIIDLHRLAAEIPKIMEYLEMSEAVDINSQDNKITVEITGSIFNTICQQTDNQPRTHIQVGCLLASALACILAKTTGKPVIIQNETRSQENRTTTIEYLLRDE